MQGDFFFSVIRCISTSFLRYFRCFRRLRTYDTQDHTISHSFSAGFPRRLHGTVRTPRTGKRRLCDDLTKHVQQVQQLHVASGTTPCPTKRRTPQQSATTRLPTACGSPIWTTPTLLREKRQNNFGRVCISDSSRRQIWASTRYTCISVPSVMPITAPSYFPSGSSRRFRPASHSAGGGTPAAPVCPRLDQSPCGCKMMPAWVPL